jgi:capsular exopolysaccharide synthesis family protein
VDQHIADQRALLEAEQRELRAAQSTSGAASAALGRYAGLQRRQDALLREIENHKSAVSLLVANVESLGIRAKAAHSPASIVSEAGPARKVAPRTLSAIAAALLAGLLLGFVVSLFMEHMDERIQTHGDARSVLGSPVMGFIPSIVNASPLGLPAESYRALRANVQFATLDRPLRSLLICSTLPGEGKSMTAMNLAVAMAMEGKRVVLVDADLRSPSIHESLGVPAYPGLSDILLGNVPLPLALHGTSVESLSVIPAGRHSADAVDALTLSAVGALQGALREYCDVAIFDGPPLLSASEALVLAAGLEAVLYVVEIGGTPRPLLVQAGDLLVQARAHVLGIVANKAEIGSGSYGYGAGAGRYRDSRKRPSGPPLPLPGAGRETREGLK